MNQFAVYRDDLFVYLNSIIIINRIYLKVFLQQNRKLTEKTYISSRSQSIVALSVYPGDGSFFVSLVLLLSLFNTETDCESTS